MDLKKNVKTYLCIRKFQLKKNTFFFDRNAKKYSKSKINFWNAFLKVFRNFEAWFFFKVETFFHIGHVIFRVGSASVHNVFF